MKVAVCISKRAALAELVGSYIEEKDARKAMRKKRRKTEVPLLSLKDQFTDLLFPETKQTKQQDEEIIETRQVAKIILGYWISLGE